MHTSSIPASGLAVPLCAADPPACRLPTPAGWEGGPELREVPFETWQGAWHPIHTGMPTGLPPGSPHSGKLRQRSVTFPEALAPELPMPKTSFGSCLNRMKNSRHRVMYGNFGGDASVVHSLDKVPTVLCASKSTPQLCANAGI